MTVETTARYISDFNEAYPRAADLINEGDDHIRMIKAVLKNTMPGFTSTVNITSDKLNQINDTFEYDDASDEITINSGLTMAADKTLNAGGNTIKNLGDPTEEGDAVSLKYLQAKGAWPVGSIYMTVDARNPAEIFGFGKWVEFAKGRCIIGTGTASDANLTSKTFKNEESGGEFEHVISEEEAPTHSHDLSEAVTSASGKHKHQNGYLVRSDSNFSNMPFGATEKWDTGGVSAHTYEHHKYQGTWMGYTSEDDSEHEHTLSGTTGEYGKSKALSLMQPWIAVNIYKRTE